MSFAHPCWPMGLSGLLLFHFLVHSVFGPGAYKWMRVSHLFFCVSLAALGASFSFWGGFVLEGNLSCPLVLPGRRFCCETGVLCQSQSQTEIYVYDHYHPLLLKIRWPVTFGLLPGFCARFPRAAGAPRVPQHRSKGCPCLAPHTRIES